MLGFADETTSRRVVSALEGEYNLERVSESVQNKITRMELFPKVNHLSQEILILQIVRNILYLKRIVTMFS